MAAGSSVMCCRYLAVCSRTDGSRKFRDVLQVSCGMFQGGRQRKFYAKEVLNKDMYLDDIQLQTINAVYLLVGTIMDIKGRKIPKCYIFAGAFLSLVTAFFLKEPDWRGKAAGLAFGGFVLFFARLTREGIGYGDGFVLCCIGFLLGLRKVLLLGLIAVLMGSGFAMVLLFFFKRKGKDVIPFLPCLFLGQCILLIFNVQ